MYVRATGVPCSHMTLVLGSIGMGRITCRWWWRWSRCRWSCITRASARAPTVARTTVASDTSLSSSDDDAPACSPAASIAPAHAAVVIIMLQARSVGVQYRVKLAGAVVLAARAWVLAACSTQILRGLDFMWRVSPPQMFGKAKADSKDAPGVTSAGHAWTTFVRMLGWHMSVVLGPKLASASSAEA